GGSVLAGVTHVVRSPYLLNVGVFMLLFSITSTFLYFQQAAIVSGAFRDRAAQTAFFATVDLGVNVLTLVVQLFLTARVVMLLGALWRVNALWLGRRQERLAAERPYARDNALDARRHVAR